MSDHQILPGDPKFDPSVYIGISRNTDGSITRRPLHPESPASSDLSNLSHLSKDININQSKNTWARVFVPRKVFNSSPTAKLKLPVIIYFHAGGFVVSSAASSLFDDFYTAMVTEIRAVVVSVEYRNAPENRLPAAYDDCMEALHWIKNFNDEWLTNYADISKCFLMGTSAGGNIGYHVGLRAAAIVDDLKPLEIRGLILHQPFFSGSKRSDSELRLANNKALPLCLADLLWDLSLPIGADRDHHFCNPVTGMKSGLFDQIKALSWKVLVTGFDGDPMIDRQIELVKKLEENGVSVESKFDEGGCHGCDLVEPTKLKELSKIAKQFVASSLAS